MTYFDIIRGHKLVLWSRRLGFTDKDFLSRLDPQGIYYVLTKEQTDEDTWTVLLLVKLKDDNIPYPIIFTCTDTQIKYLVETFELE